MPSDDPVDKPALLHREESTTPDLVERVRDLWAYGAHGDWGSILRLYAPRAVWDMSPVGLGTYEDLAALRGRWQDWIDAYEELEVDVEEVLDLGHGVVLALIAQKGRPLGSSRH